MDKEVRLSVFIDFKIDDPHLVELSCHLLVSAIDFIQHVTHLVEVGLDLKKFPDLVVIRFCSAVALLGHLFIKLMSNRREEPEDVADSID